MKAAMRILGTVCFGVLLFVSGVLAQETVKTPLANQNAVASEKARKTQARVSVVEYVKAVETINAYNATHKKQTVIPGVTKVSLQLVPETGFRSGIDEKLRDWDEFRTSPFQRQQLLARIYELEYAPANDNNDWASTWSDEYWRKQELGDEFKRDRFVAKTYTPHITPAAFAPPLASR